MEKLIELLVLAVGGGLFVFVFVWPLLKLVMLIGAYIRYHLTGQKAPVIDTFYRANRGEFVPDPSKLRGFAAIGALVVVVVLMVRLFLPA